VLDIYDNKAVIVNLLADETNTGPSPLVLGGGVNTPSNATGGCIEQARRLSGTLIDILDET
jgi:hypothetical protein